MYWHESDNETSLRPFNKRDFNKNISKDKNKEDNKEDEPNKDNILDLSDKFKIDMIIPSDWGPGKVVRVNKETRKVVLKIEGQEQTFDMFELQSHLSVYIHVYLKDINFQDRRIIISSNLTMDDTIGKIKKRIAGIFNTEEKNVIIVHNGEKMTNDSLKVSDGGFFVGDNLLVVINGLCDY